MQRVRVMRHSLKEKRRSLENPGEKNHISEAGRIFAANCVPVVLAGLGNFFPVYIGPESRNKETGKAMGILKMQVEKLFDVLPMEEVKPYLPKADALVKKHRCNIVTALFQIPEIAHVFKSAGEKYRKGILKIAKLNSRYEHIFVIAHGGPLEPAANIRIGLDELDWVDFWVVKQQIVHAVVSRHIAMD